jgi:hypothetical protein
MSGNSHGGVTTRTGAKQDHDAEVADQGSLSTGSAAVLNNLQVVHFL